MQGTGIMTWPDGKQYTGSFEKGLRHGQGKLVYKDGREYDGGWVQGK